MKKSITFEQLKRYLRESRMYSEGDAAPAPDAVPVDPNAVPADPAAAPVDAMPADPAAAAAPAAVDPNIKDLVMQLALACGLQCTDPAAAAAPAAPAADPNAAPAPAPVAERRRRMAETRHHARRY